jgi:4-amino-4-deoxy-L-arabinose transferase-like glycosyltransferase
LKPDQQHKPIGLAARPQRAELLLILLIVLAGGCVRFAVPSRMAVEHFDEGVYASNIWFGQENDYRYPARHLYAPPLLPSLIEWSIILCGHSHLSIMLVSLTASTATIVLVWQTARCWFGAEAGIAAATLAALSDFHIVYSRTALTDPLLCFWLLLAIYFTTKMFRRDHLGWAIAAGLATGLAWSTKYNGWLPLGIAGGVLLLQVILQRRDGKAYPWKRCLTAWLAMVASALLVWTPVWFDLRSRGGYSAVAANHRGYLVGLSGWWDSLVRQVGNHQHFDGWLSCAGLGLAALLPLLVLFSKQVCFTWNGKSVAVPKSSPRRNAVTNRRWAVCITGAAVALLLTALAALLSSSFTIAVMATAGIVMSLRSAPAAPSEETSTSDRRLVACLLAVWFVGLLLATPLYHPFPRLTLPWLVSAWLGAGALLGRLAHWIGERSDLVVPVAPAARLFSRRSIESVLAVCLLITVPVIIFSAQRLTSRGIPGWQSRTAQEIIAESITADAARIARSRDSNLGFVIYVYGEPGLFYQLSINMMRSELNFVTRPVGDLEFAQPNPAVSTVPTFLVAGPQAHRDKTFQDEIQRYRDRFRPMGRYPYRSSDLVLLNEYPPRRLADPSGPPQHELRMYLLKQAE